MPRMTAKVNRFEKVVKLMKNSQKEKKMIVKNKAEQKAEQKRKNTLFFAKTGKNEELLIKKKRFIRNESFA